MSIHAVAKHAGVSVATVSRAFNFPDKVLQQTLDKVYASATAVGYVPNASARTLRTQRSHVLGVVLPTLINPVFAECLEGIAQAAAMAGYAISPITTAYRVEEESKAVAQLLSRNVDGLILVVADPQTSAALQVLTERNHPYVLAYNRHPLHSCVSVDGEQAVADMVLRLGKLGHRRILMLTGQRSASDRARQRCDGYLRGMQALGLASSEVLEVPFLDSAQDDMCAVLQSRQRPSAVMCSNDLLALRCLRAAHLTGLRVPEDLSVVGFDGIAVGRDLTPTLCTVHQPSADIGQRSVEVLLSALRQGQLASAADSLTLPHRLIEGESCGLAPQDFALATAPLD